MNTIKDYITIHLQLIKNGAQGVVILVMIYLTEYVFQTKRKI